MYKRKNMRLLAGKGFRGESRRAKAACNDYLLLGPRRSVRILLEQYEALEKETPGGAVTTSESTLRNWQERYDWTERAEEYDARVAEKRQFERERVLEEGLARIDRRLEDLIRKAELLSKEIEDETKRYTKDYRTVLYGERAEEREVKVFNHQLLKEYRGLLDDIAKEVGARRVESGVDVTLTLKGYGKVDTEGNVFEGPDAWDAEGKAEQLEAGQGKALASESES